MKDTTVLQSLYRNGAYNNEANIWNRKFTSGFVTSSLCEQWLCQSIGPLLLHRNEQSRSFNSQLLLVSCLLTDSGFGRSVKIACMLIVTCSGTGRLCMCVRYFISSIPCDRVVCCTVRHVMTGKNIWCLTELWLSLILLAKVSLF